jgi:hypothetical protein
VPVFSETIVLPTPEDAIEGTEEIQVSVSGDILGPLIPNIDALIEEPMGCGEQNLARLYPNVLVLEYLESFNIEDAALERTAVRNIQLGVSRLELLYCQTLSNYLQADKISYARRKFRHFQARPLLRSLVPQLQPGRGTVFELQRF